MSDHQSKFCSGCQRWKPAAAIKTVGNRRVCKECSAKAYARRINAKTDISPRKGCFFTEQHVTNGDANAAKKAFAKGVIPPFAKT